MSAVIGVLIFKGKTTETRAGKNYASWYVFLLLDRPVSCGQGRLLDLTRLSWAISVESD